MGDDAYWKDRLRDASSGRASRSDEPPCSADQTIRDASMFLAELEGELPIRGMAFSASIAGMLSRRLAQLVPNADGQPRRGSP